MEIILVHVYRQIHFYINKAQATSYYSFGMDRESISLYDLVVIESYIFEVGLSSSREEKGLSLVTFIVK